jgi:hypothetical protein
MRHIRRAKMRPIQHPSNNDVLAPPKGAKPEECVSLAVTRICYQAPTEHHAVRTVVPAVRSYWEPSKEEREAIAAGAPVCIEVQGRTHAPIILGVAQGEGHDLVGMPFVPYQPGEAAKQPSKPY